MLWRFADELKWQSLADREKSALYEDWIRDESIGGVLSRYMPNTSVRVYIKDSIMKPYGRERIKDFGPIAKVLGVEKNHEIAERYIKPHGRRLTDGKVICWGLSREWKTILIAAFERAHIAPTGESFGVVIMYPIGKCKQPAYRRMVETVARRLGIHRLVWWEG